MSMNEIKEKANGIQNQVETLQNKPLVIQMPVDIDPKALIVTFLTIVILVLSCVAGITWWALSK